MNGKTRVKAFSTALLAKLAKQPLNGKSLRYSEDASPLQAILTKGGVVRWTVRLTKLIDGRTKELQHTLGYWSESGGGVGIAEARQAAQEAQTRWRNDPEFLLELSNNAPTTVRTLRDDYYLPWLKRDLASEEGSSRKIGLLNRLPDYFLRMEVSKVRHADLQKLLDAEKARLHAAKADGQTGISSMTTVKKYANALRTMFEFAVEPPVESPAPRLISVNPAKDLKVKVRTGVRTRHVKPGSELIEYLRSLDEMPAAFPVYVMAHAALFTGKRSKELLHMRWADLNLPDKLWIIPGKLDVEYPDGGPKKGHWKDTITTKNRKDDHVALPDLVVGLLRALKRWQVDEGIDSPWCFASMTNYNAPMSEGVLTQALARLADSSGVTKISAHDARRSFNVLCRDILRIPKEWRELLLNQSTGDVQDTNYSPTQALEVKRECVAKIDAWLHQHLGQSTWRTGLWTKEDRDTLEALLKSDERPSIESISELFNRAPDAVERMIKVLGWREAERVKVRKARRDKPKINACQQCGASTGNAMFCSRRCGAIATGKARRIYKDRACDETERPSVALSR